MKHNFRLAKRYSLANQKLYYIQMLLNVEKSEEQDQECSEEWLVRIQTLVLFNPLLNNHLYFDDPADEHIIM